MNSKFLKSQNFLKRSQQVIPLGSQTFSKCYTQYPIGNAPLYIKSGKGGRVWDVDGNEFVDLVCGLLPVVLGYCDDDIDQAIQRQLKSGITFSLPSPLETELAERLVEIIPCAEMVRFGKNGTDATSAAIRLARAYTGRDHIIALGYHGWQDWYIGSTTRNKGVPDAVSELTHRIPYNDISSVKEIIEQYHDDVAAIIMEPMTADEPLPGYLEEIRSLTYEKEIVLIFDEVITGFRYSLGGAQELFDVTPDLATFGKAMGNGMPISAVVGRSDIMSEMEHVFYSGTFGGETLSIAAAIAVVDKMIHEPVIEKLWSNGTLLSEGIKEKILLNDLSNIVTLKGKPPWTILSFHDNESASAEVMKTFYMVEMLNNGVLTLGTHNICYAHNDDDINMVLSAYDIVLSKLADEIKCGDLAKRLSVPIIQPVFQVRNN